jgi:hypothetical protein
MRLWGYVIIQQRVCGDMIDIGQGYLSVVLARTASTATLALITPRWRMAGVMQPSAPRSASIAAVVVHTRVCAALCDCASMSSN